jgi:hypothetical protein
MHSLLEKLFVSVCGDLVKDPFDKLVKDSCWGCQNPDCALNQMAHDTCLVMSDEERARLFLPGALKQLHRREVVQEFCARMRELKNEELQVGDVIEVIE